ncbi:MAG: thiamine diphosphokinase [Tissierellia bacterium]|nr:thiamine diphosphokinase [Tissierellia bacterium]
MKDAIILGGGNIVDISVMSKYLKKDTDIICVDRGYDYAVKHKLKVRIAIGDFDSVNNEYISELENATFDVLRFNEDKDMTDMQLALDYCITNEYDHIYIFGGLGTRMDHSVANMNLLNLYYDKNPKVYLIDDTNMIYVAKIDIELENHEGYNLSLIISEGSPQITLTGVKWPLHNHQMIQGESLTISNKIIDQKAYLQINNGGCYILYSKD